MTYFIYFLLLLPIHNFIHRSYHPSNVIELFSSQGCSSCPPAYRALSQIAEKHPTMLLTSYHVDYWNYLDWYDIFSLADCTERQQIYGGKFNLSSIYTPQAIINGREETVGSNTILIESMMQHTHQYIDTTSIAEVEVIPSSNNKAVTFHIHTKNKKLLYYTCLMLYKQAITFVQRGENAGKTLIEKNIVGAMKSSNDQDIILDIPADSHIKNMTWVVIAQEPSSWYMVDAWVGN